GVLTAEEVEEIVWWADRRDVLILCDESFERFQYDGEAVGVAALPKAARRTLTAGGVSKGHALASARVGWLTAHRHLLTPCRAAACAARAAPAGGGSASRPTTAGCTRGCTGCASTCRGCGRGGRLCRRRQRRRLARRRRRRVTPACSRGAPG